MRYLCSLATILALALPLASCQESDPEPGSKGGRCRVTLIPCDANLVCRDNACREASDTARPPLDAIFDLVRVIPDGEAAPDDEVMGEGGMGGEGGMDGPVGTKPPYVAEARGDDLTMRADGRDRAAVRVTVLRRDTRAPWSGTVRLWVDPPTAGVLTQTMLELDDEGRAVTNFIACDKTDPDCPWRAVIKVTESEEILTFIGSTPYIWLEGGNRPPPPDTGEGGTGGTGGADVDAGTGGVQIPDGVVPWGEPSTQCPRASTWSWADKPEGFVMTGWGGSARGGVKVNFNYVLASDPTRTLEGTYNFRGTDEPGSHRLTTAGMKFEITLNNDEIVCTDGVVILLQLERKQGDALRLVQMDYRAKCGPELEPINGCFYLSDEPNEPAE